MKISHVCLSKADLSEHLHEIYWGENILCENRVRVKTDPPSQRERECVTKLVGEPHLCSVGLSLQLQQLVRCKIINNNLTDLAPPKMYTA